MYTIKPLEHLLIDRGMTKKQLYEGANFSKTTMDRITRGEDIRMGTLVKICRYLQVPLEDVIEINGVERK